MSTIDQQFVEYIVKSIVSNPEEVKIERTVDERGVLLELTVDPADLGRVIGKRGSGAQSLRTLLRALGTKNDARYNLKIVDSDEASSGRPNQSTADAEKATDDDSHNDNVDSSSEIEDSDGSDEGISEESSRLAQTRRELEDLDDLDI